MCIFRNVSNYFHFICSIDETHCYIHFIVYGLCIIIIKLVERKEFFENDFNLRKFSLENNSGVNIHSKTFMSISNGRFYFLTNSFIWVFSHVFCICVCVLYVFPSFTNIVVQYSTTFSTFPHHRVIFSFYTIRYTLYPIPCSILTNSKWF